MKILSMSMLTYYLHTRCIRRTGPGPRCKINIIYSVVGGCDSIARRTGRQL